MKIYTKEEAKKAIQKLVEKFENNVEYYKDKYVEAQARIDFINLFFEALGWDIYNKQDLAESYREVIYEDKVILDDGKKKAPDYCFTKNGKKMFYVEAKKPGINIKEHVESAYQLRRYGWSAKLPICILTDFEEFAVYDCTVMPNPNDIASIARIDYLTYKDYASNFDMLLQIFGKESVYNGSLDNAFNNNKNKKGTTEVGEAFLKSLDNWRNSLAKSIYLNNNKIDEDTLNYSMQKIIDRLLFLRICEDRGVEIENQLFNSIGKNSYLKLKNIFHNADQKYNSGLFDYKKDKITDDLIIDDATLKEIIEEMYYPKSPYEFSVIPVEILGHSYEQYLGKVIKIIPGKQMTIEEKPEVRKAGGVYYTPQYIVDYIVKNTVGKLVENKTPEEVAKLKICDPACGSGSFLIGTYQFLLDWHREYYLKAKQKNKENFFNPDGNLTTAIKKQILLNNIYGVDIDTNAVEVTKLSLMLKAMEGETKATINNQLSAFHDRVLPSLDDNIKSGNSLIASDFYIDNKPSLFNEKEKRKINTFDWEREFPEIFKKNESDYSKSLSSKIDNHFNAASNYLEGAKYHIDKAADYIEEATNLTLKEETLIYNAELDSKKNSGFDVIIGNPPYGVEFKDEMKTYFKLYYSYSDSELESYILFIEKSLDLLKNFGMFGFIVPSNLLTNSRYSKIRNRILNFKIDTLIDNGSNVFNTASVDTCIFVLQNINPLNNLINTSILNRNSNFNNFEFKQIEQISFRESEFNLFNLNKNKFDIELENKIGLNKIPLKEFVNFARGIEFGYSSEYTSNKILSNKSKKLISGRCINRYLLKFENKYVEYDHNDVANFKNNSIYENSKILLRRIGLNLIAVYDDEKYYNVCDVYNLTEKNNTNLKFLLSIINSKLLSYLKV